MSCQIRVMRRQGRIGEFVSVYLNVVQKTVNIASDGGRVCRPLLVVEKGKSLQSHSILLLSLYMYKYDREN
jgi:DNA-directed RNA polymerase III subunit RPC2